MVNKNSIIMATAWFKYKGSGSITNPLSYTLVGVAPICPAPNEAICAIFAGIQLIAGSQRPVITPVLHTAIQVADLVKAESADVKLKPNC